MEDAKKEKRTKKERKLMKGTPVETDAAVKINKGGLRQQLLDDFHRSLKKSSQKTLRLFHSYTRADDDYSINPFSRGSDPP